MGGVGSLGRDTSGLTVNRGPSDLRLEKTPRPRLGWVAGPLGELWGQSVTRCSRGDPAGLFLNELSQAHGSGLSALGNIHIQQSKPGENDSSTARITGPAKPLGVIWTGYK